MPSKKPRFTVLRDTAEHEGHGWNFAPSQVCSGTVERNLFTGDYSLDGLEQEKIFVVERKGSLSEFYGNLTNDWTRFNDELQRLDEFKFPYLVLEFLPGDITWFPRGSGIPRGVIRMSNPPDFIIRKLWEIELKHKTRVMFVGKYSERYMLSLFKRMAELYSDKLLCPV